MSPTQSQQLVGHAAEVTPGTFVPPTAYIPGIATPQTQTKYAAPAQSRGTRSQVVDAIVGESVGFQFAAELIPEVLSTEISSWFGQGADAKTASGAAITHTLSPQPLQNSLSYELDSDAVTQKLARRFSGCKVDEMVLKATNQSLATLQFTMKALLEATPATPGAVSNPTPTITTLQPMDFSLLAALYNGSSTSQLMDLTITAQNNVQEVYASNGLLTPGRLQETLRKVTVNTSLDFLDATFYADWFGGRNITRPIVVTLSNPSILIPTTATPYSIAFSLPRLRANGTYNLSSSSDVLQQAIDFSATLGTGGELGAVIINSETSVLS